MSTSTEPHLVKDEAGRFVLSLPTAPSDLLLNQPVDAVVFSLDGRSIAVKIVIGQHELGAVSAELEKGMNVEPVHHALCALADALNGRAAGAHERSKWLRGSLLEDPRVETMAIRPLAGNYMLKQDIDQLFWSGREPRTKPRSKGGQRRRDRSWPASYKPTCQGKRR